MITNPLARKPRTPVDKALDALGGVRTEAARTAAGVRDAATKTTEVLGGVAPAARSKRIPLAAAAFGTAIGVALGIRAKLGSRADDVSPAAAAQPARPPVAATPTPTAAATAAKATAVKAAPAGEPKPVSEAGSEEPAQPAAETVERKAEPVGTGTGKRPADEVEPEQPKDPKAKTDESGATRAKPAAEAASEVPTAETDEGSSASS